MDNGQREHCTAMNPLKSQDRPCPETTVWCSFLAVPLARILRVLLHTLRGCEWRGCACYSKGFLGTVPAAPGAGASNLAWVISIRPQRRENLNYVLMVGCRQTEHRVRKGHSRQRATLNSQCCVVFLALMFPHQIGRTLNARGFF